MKIDPSCCRLCFIYEEDPIEIFGDTLTESKITDLLAQYFMDQVTQDDALPKVVCHDCWNQIEVFHSFVQRIIAVREDYIRQSWDDCAKEENGEETSESVPSMDEMNIHEEDVCVEPVSMGSGDPTTSEIELMDTKFQIDMKTEEIGAVFNANVECDEIGFDSDQIYDQNTINTKLMAHIATHTESKSSRDPLDSPNDANEYICDICNESFGSKFLVKKHLHAHFEKPQKPTCHICKEQFKSKRNLERHSRYAHVESPDEDPIESKPDPMDNDDSVPNVSEESEEGPEEKLGSIKRGHQLCDISEIIQTSSWKSFKTIDDATDQEFTSLNASKNVSNPKENECLYGFKSDTFLDVLFIKAAQQFPDLPAKAIWRAKVPLILDNLYKSMDSGNTMLRDELFQIEKTIQKERGQKRVIVLDIKNAPNPYAKRRRFKK